MSCTSSTQQVISLSSGESEYYALVRGTLRALGMRALMSDIGMPETTVQIFSDSTAAMGVAKRRGVGKKSDM